jgi:2-polyprenyl-3-methyl-5-hydroxy-6-metoxy-1,4-benzoquinol methylase
MKRIFYTPDIFEQSTLADAKRIILTVPPDILDDFWQRATRATADLIVDALLPTEPSTLLDFGCGIGRLAKELIQRTGCKIVGVDISASMRRLAVEYVASDRFSVMSSDEFARLAANRTAAFSGAYSIVVLQHVLDPATELRRIAATCAASAPLFIYNCINRCVPTNLGFANDGQDIGRLASEIFAFKQEFDVPRDLLLYPDRGPLPGEIESHWFRLFVNERRGTA